VKRKESRGLKFLYAKNQAPGKNSPGNRGALAGFGDESEVGNSLEKKIVLGEKR